MAWIDITTAPDEPQHPRAARLGPNRWRAEVSGIVGGAIVRSCVGKTYATKDEALAEAVRLAQPEPKAATTEREEG